MKRKNIKKILYKVNSGSSSAEEEQTVMYWLHYFRGKEIPALSELELTEESDIIYKSLMERKEIKPAKIWLPWHSAVAAAAIIFFISVGIHYFIQSNTIKPAHDLIAANDIAPGKNIATLTLANGKKIILSSAIKGLIAKQSGASIFKTEDGKLIYKSSDTKTDKTGFNTIATANGQQYQLILSDGTLIWINAGSSLTYPTTFSDLKNRKVKLSGEAYFEVAKDKTHPFIVKTDNQEVQVLGTHFNISSYLNENATKTTLLEGSIRVSNSKGQRVLLPGQQSSLTQGSLSVSKANIKQVVAWKNGDFIFNNEEFGSILRQVSRWYNVEIISKGDYKDLRLSGTVSRSRNISTVLRALEVTGKVKFKIEGKRILVLE